MNVSLHIDASELTHLELRDRKYGDAQGQRMVIVDGNPRCAVWVASASEARDVAMAFLALAGEIDLDDLRASMDTLPSLHCEMAAQAPPVGTWRVVDDSELGALGGTS